MNYFVLGKICERVIKETSHRVISLWLRSTVMYPTYPLVNRIKYVHFMYFFFRIFDTKNNNTFIMIYLLYMYFTLPLYIILFISSWCSAWNGPWFAEEWERVRQEAEEHTGHLCWAPEVSHGWYPGAIN